MPATVEMLADVTMFALMDERERASVCELLESRYFASGQTVFNFGDASGDFYIVHRGKVQVYVETTEGERIVLREIGPGEVFGDISMFDGGPRTATAVAIEDTEVLAMGRTELHALVRKHPHSAIDLLTVMGQRLRATNELLRSQVSRNPNVEEEERLTFAQRIADRVAEFGGSWTFIISFAVFIGAWMAVNFELARHAFDPYPYILLNLVLSTLAAFQAPVIMMSQNRFAAKDRLKADLDYEVNRKAELEVAQLHSKAERIYEAVQVGLARLEEIAQVRRVGTTARD